MNQIPQQFYLVFQVTDIKGFPALICRKCERYLMQAVELRATIVKSDNYFRFVLRNQRYIWSENLMDIKALSEDIEETYISSSRPNISSTASMESIVSPAVLIETSSRPEALEETPTSHDIKSEHLESESTPAKEKSADSPVAKTIEHQLATPTQPVEQLQPIGLTQENETPKLSEPVRQPLSDEWVQAALAILNAPVPDSDYINFDINQEDLDGVMLEAEDELDDLLTEIATSDPVSKNLTEEAVPQSSQNKPIVEESSQENKTKSTDTKRTCEDPPDEDFDFDFIDLISSDQISEMTEKISKVLPKVDKRLTTIVSPKSDRNSERGYQNTIKIDLKRSKIISSSASLSNKSEVSTANEKRKCNKRKKSDAVLDDGLGRGKRRIMRNRRLTVG